MLPITLVFFSEEADRIHVGLDMADDGLWLPRQDILAKTFQGHVDSFPVYDVELTERGMAVFSHRPID